MFYIRMDNDSPFSLPASDDRLRRGSREQREQKGRQPQRRYPEAYPRAAQTRTKICQRAEVLPGQGVQPLRTSSHQRPARRRPRHRARLRFRYHRCLSGRYLTDSSEHLKRRCSRWCCYPISSPLSTAINERQES